MKTFANRRGFPCHNRSLATSVSICVRIGATVHIILMQIITTWLQGPSLPWLCGRVEVDVDLPAEPGEEALVQRLCQSIPRVARIFHVLSTYEVLASSTYGPVHV